MGTSILHLGVRRPFALVLGLYAVACDDDLLQPPPRTIQPPPAAFQLVSGSNQEGKNSIWLPEPFVVRVTDASGNGLRGLAVRWSVASGEGVLGIVDGPGPGELGSQVEILTNALGEARIRFRPKAFGRTSVTATMATLPTLTFTTDVTTLSMFWWGAFYGPEGLEQNVSMPIGNSIEWSPFSTYPVRIRSTEVPPGGESFDTVEYTGTFFRFLPGVVGTWSYVVEYVDKPGYQEPYTLTVQ